MKSLIAVSLLLLPLGLAAADWRTTPESSLGFVGSAQGESFEGRFNEFDAHIRFDPTALDTGEFDVRIVLASADTQNAERDELLPQEDFFNVAAGPEAGYSAASFEALGGDRFRALGELTLRGVTAPVALEFSWVVGEGNSARLEGEAKLSRLAFGVGGGEWADTSVIDDEVLVRTRLALQLAD
jgi:polyisoprenoid-binding protein YceI